MITATLILALIAILVFWVAFKAIIKCLLILEANQHELFKHIRHAVLDIHKMADLEKGEHKKTRKDIQEVKTRQAQVRKDLNTIQAQLTRALYKSVKSKGKK